MRAVARLASTVAALTLTAGQAACSSGETRPVATGDEQLVCTHLRTMVDQLARQQGPEALVSLDELQKAVAATPNTQLSKAGKVFFDAISQPVEDPGSLTARQSKELGDRVLAASGAGLADLFNACAQLGMGVPATR